MVKDVKSHWPRAQNCICIVVLPTNGIGTHCAFSSSVECFTLAVLHYHALIFDSFSIIPITCYATELVRDILHPLSSALGIKLV